MIFVKWINKPLLNTHFKQMCKLGSSAILPFSSFSYWLILALIVYQFYLAPSLLSLPPFWTKPVYYYLYSCNILSSYFWSYPLPISSCQNCHRSTWMNQLIIYLFIHLLAFKTNLKQIILLKLSKRMKVNI